jgi:hypothetical protein
MRSDPFVEGVEISSDHHGKGEPVIMKPLISYKTSRRTFLQACATGAVAAGSGAGIPSAMGISTGVSPSHAVVRLEPDPKRPLIPVLSWDTEGGERFRTNLLRSPGVGLRVRLETLWLDGTDLPSSADKRDGGAHYRLQAAENCTLRWDVSVSQDSFTMTLSTEGSATLPPGSVELVFRFDPRVTPTTVLPAEWQADGKFDPPLVISSPDFGPMLLSVSTLGKIRGRLEGNRSPVHMIDLVLEMPELSADRQITMRFTPVTLAPPEGLGDESMWRLARRGWFNSFQPAASWGDQNDLHHHNGPPGILANNVVSDPASVSQILYADPTIWIPEVAEGVSVARLVRRSVEFWLEKRTLMSHEVIGYTDYVNFLDANPNVLISAWDYVEATEDLAWLERTIRTLELIADFTALRDQDHDGLAEATQSGNADTLWALASCNWFDAVNYGYKDAYSNALIYRAWRCLADLEGRLHRDQQRARYTQLADQLKAAYGPALYNPQSGFLACWKSADGKLHDYASPIVNSMAVEYGLVGPEQGRKIIENLWTKMQAVGFTRFDLGIPSTLEPVHRSDYLQPDGFGIAQREDGTDTFQQYQNGGVSAGCTLHFLIANYLLGYQEKADNLLRAMLGRQQSGAFQNGVQDVLPRGGEWVTWDGKPCGYEGYLADVYFFLQAVLLREPAFRKRYLGPLSIA